MTQVDGGKGAFFDLYGTLLVYGDMDVAWTEWLEALYDLLVPRGLDHGRDYLAERCHGFFAKEDPPVTEGLTLLERRISRLVAELDLRVSLEDIRMVATSVVNVWEDHISLDPEAHDVLHALGSYYQLGLISNFDHPPHVRAVLDKHGLSDLFDVISISGEVGVKKPDPRVFDSGLLSLGLTPQACFYLGDTAEDAVCANAAGIRSITIERIGAADSSVRPVKLDFLHIQGPRVVAKENLGHTEVIRSLSDLLTLAEA